MTTSSRDRDESTSATASLPPDNLRRARPAMTRRRFILSGLVLTGAAAAGDLTHETRSLTITRHTLRLSGLKQPCRLAQLSDLHRSWCVSEDFIQGVVSCTNALKPDVVALTGDFVTRHSDYIGSCTNALRSLRAPLGLFAVLGNHDYVSDNRRGGPAVAEGLRGMDVSSAHKQK